MDDSFIPTSLLAALISSSSAVVLGAKADKVPFPVAMVLYHVHEFWNVHWGPVVGQVTQQLPGSVSLGGQSMRGTLSDSLNHTLSNHVCILGWQISDPFWLVDNILI